MGGVKAHYEGIKAFSETDFTDDLKAIDVPTLVMNQLGEQFVWPRVRNGEMTHGDLDVDDVLRGELRHGGRSDVIDPQSVVTESCPAALLPPA